VPRTSDKVREDVAESGSIKESVLSPSDARYFSFARDSTLCIDKLVMALKNQFSPNLAFAFAFLFAHKASVADSSGELVFIPSSHSVLLLNTFSHLVQYSTSARTPPVIQQLLAWSVFADARVSHHASVTAAAMLAAVALVCKRLCLSATLLHRVLLIIAVVTVVDSVDSSNLHISSHTRSH
jgi:hypothetical protein